MSKKEYAVNRNLWLPILLFAVFLALSVSCAAEREWLMLSSFLLLALLCVFVVLIQPLVMVFSKEEIQIIYTVGVRETIPTAEIQEIYAEGGWFSRYTGWPVYTVVYPAKSKKPFFVLGQLSKTRRVKKLLKRVYRKDFS